MSNAERLLLPIAIVALIGTALWWSGPGGWISDAQPVRHEVFEGATVTRSGDCATVDIRFNFTVQYVRHFPQDKGSSLYMQVRPAHFGPAAAAALSTREAVVARGDDAGPLESIVYDGTTEGCPIVILDFDKPVHFSVAQGADFGSVRVAYSLSEDGPRCPVQP
jgi:nitrogen fixation-related uncharacterized protein